MARREVASSAPEAGVGIGVDRNRVSPYSQALSPSAGAANRSGSRARNSRPEEKTGTQLAGNVATRTIGASAGVGVSDALAFSPKDVGWAEFARAADPLARPGRSICA